MGFAVTAVPKPVAGETRRAIQLSFLRLANELTKTMKGLPVRLNRDLVVLMQEMSAEERQELGRLYGLLSEFCGSFGMELEDLPAEFQPPASA